MDWFKPFKKFKTLPHGSNHEKIGLNSLNSYDFARIFFAAAIIDSMIFL